MEDNNMHSTVEPVPYIAHEAEMARMERVNRRWFIAWLITFLLLVGCVAGFIWYEAQFTDEITETIETTAEGGGNAYGTLISGNGSNVNYGESQSNADKAPNP